MMLCSYQQGGSEFRPVVASRGVLRSLSRTEVIVCSWPKPLRNQYFKIVMVDVPIMHCNSCNKVRQGRLAPLSSLTKFSHPSPPRAQFVFPSFSFFPFFLPFLLHMFFPKYRQQVWGSSNNNNNRHDNVYGAVIVAVHCHCESSPGSSDECSTQRQVAADLWTKPISLSQQIRLQAAIVTTFTFAIYYYSARKLILVFHPTEGRRLSRPSWLVSDRDGLPARRQSPIQILTGPAVEQLR